MIDQIAHSLESATGSTIDPLNHNLHYIKQKLFPSQYFLNNSFSTGTATRVFVFKSVSRYHVIFFFYLFIAAVYVFSLFL